MMTLHAAERYFERVLKAPVDREYICNNFYHLGMLIKNSYDKSILIGEDITGESTGVKHYIHENIIYVVDAKGVMVTIFTINTNEETRIKYLANIAKLREEVSKFSTEVEKLKTLLNGYRDIINSQLVRDIQPIMQLAEQTEILLNSVLLNKTVVEIKLKFTAKALVCGRYVCNNHTILDAYKEELYKGNSLYNFNSESFKVLEKMILEH